MKKICDKVLVVLMSIILIITTIPIAKYEVRGENVIGEITDNDANIAWSFNEANGVLEISGSGGIPDYYDYESTPWYIYRNKVSRIIIREGITKIGQGAFYNMQESIVEFPKNSLLEIGASSFSYNRNLKRVVIPDSVTIIGGSAFYICTSINYIYVPGTVQSIPNFAFTNVGGVCEVGEGCTSIGHYGIAGNFSRLVLPSSLTSFSLNALGDYGGASVIYGNSSAIMQYAYSENIPYVDTSTKYSILNADISVVADAKYTGREICPNLYLTYTHGNSNIKLLQGYDYTIEYKNNINLGEASILITGLGIYSNVISKKFLIYEDINECEIELENNNYLYDGTAKTPEITVKLGNEILVKDKDYTVEYSNNTEEGQATVTIIGKNVFKGTISKSFSIYKNDIRDCTVALEYESVRYDGTAKTPNVTVKLGNETLVKDRDYTVEYSNNTEEGQASVTITGKNSCKGNISKQFTIYKNELSGCAVYVEYDSAWYDGVAKTPAVSVVHGDTILTKDADYKVTYQNNIECGTANVVVEGLNSYKGTVVKTFSIYKKDISTYPGVIEYTVTVADKTAKTPAITVTTPEGVSLINGVDYTVSYADNILPGIATAMVTGIGRYTGTITVQFEIQGVSLENADCKLNKSIYTYDGSDKKPDPTVKMNGYELVEDVDYTVSYKNNRKSGQATVVIAGIGMYVDQVELSYTILPYNAGMESVYDEGTLISGKLVYGITDDESHEVEVCCPSNKNISQLQIPATIKDEDGVVYKVTSIGQKAFYKNSKIKSIVIGNNVKSIESYAFYGCTNVTSIKLGRAVEIIGASSFRKCTKLTSITLPKNVDELGKNAFYGCSRLKTIIINANSVVDIQDNAIKGISKKAVIKVPKKQLKKYQKEFGKKSGYTKKMKIRAK